MGSHLVRPAVSLKLVRPDGTMTPPTYGLVDSGCDVSTFPTSWAPVLGIDLAKDCDEGVGNTAGGQTKAYHYNPGITALLMGTQVPLVANFNEGLPIILLGREDFFSHFKVSFDQRRKQFTLEVY
jgi:hypothetical protein